jgi:osmotically-inducible protein OsmY
MPNDPRSNRPRYFEEGDQRRGPSDRGRWPEAPWDDRADDRWRDEYGPRRAGWSRPEQSYSDAELESYRRGSDQRRREDEALDRELRDRGHGYVGRNRNYGFAGGQDRGFWHQAADEVKSWFGSDDGGQSRAAGSGPSYRGRGPKGHSRSDERIREDVSDRIMDDPHIDGSDIELTVSGGEVTLTGTVGSRGEKRRAEDVADSVSGVSHVQNNLRVKQRDAGAWGT